MNLFNYPNKKKLSANMRPNLVSGFTLVELLVAISIIGLLSSVVYANLSSANTKARDAKRLSDMAQIQKALELYYDQYEAYPSYSNWALNYPGYTGNWNDLVNKLSPYLKVPLDPKDTYPPAAYAYPYHYYSQGLNGQGYYLLMQPENSNVINQGQGCWGGWYCRKMP